MVETLLVLGAVAVLAFAGLADSLVAPETLLYAGGVWLWTYDGSRWTQILPAHVDQHALAWADKALLVGNDGGVFTSTDPTGSWKSHNGGLTLTQFYHGALHPQDLPTDPGGEL